MDQQRLGLHAVTRAQQFLGHTDDVIAPVARGRERRQFGCRPLPRFFLFLGVNAEPSVGRIRDRGEACQIECDGEHEPQVVIGVLSDEIHASRRPKDANVAGRSILLAKELGDHDRVRAHSNITPPKASMAMPQYKLMLTSVRDARSPGENTPSNSKMTPSATKNEPEVVRRSTMA